MQADLILGLAFAGIALGVIEGIKPGPLLTMVIRETLTGGLRAGVRTAAAPIFTDGPLILVSLLMANWVADQPTVLWAISVLGAAFLAWMGIECFGIEPPSADIQEAEVTGSFKRGVLTNLLNPNVYIFWFLIGGPLMASAASEEPIAPVAYAVCFLLSVILVKSLSHTYSTGREAGFQCARTASHCPYAVSACSPSPPASPTRRTTCCHRSSSAQSQPLLRTGGTESKRDDLGDLHSMPRSSSVGEASQNSSLPRCILAHERLILGWNKETSRDSE